MYQYLQSVQAYVGAPITATFLVGILWRGATARAAFTTLIFGGLVGAARFTLDILRNALKWDLGPLNDLVSFSFLNFSVIVFLICVGLMVGVSRLTAHQQTEAQALSVDWGQGFERRNAEIAYTLIVGGAIAVLWVWFA